jgi:hypothetical protein
MRYCVLGQRLNTYPAPEELRSVLRRSVTVLDGSAGSQFEAAREDIGDILQASFVSKECMRET